MSGSSLTHVVCTSLGEKQYLSALADLPLVGHYRAGRNGGTHSAFGRQMHFDLSKGFPLLTTKRVFWRGVVEELLWFLRGETNVRSLQEKGVSIWDEWADAEGELGPVYGRQWRSWPSYEHPDRSAIDQIANVVEGLRNDPYGRRHIVSAWNPDQIDQMALPPCHALFQFYVGDDRRLSCQLYQRSADMFLGVPFNIASYALLTVMIAHVTGLKPGNFVHTLGDYHVYDDHLPQVTEQIQRRPSDPPVLVIGCDPERPITSIDGFEFENFVLQGYAPQASIKAEVRV